VDWKFSVGAGVFDFGPIHRWLEGLRQGESAAATDSTQSTTGRPLAAGGAAGGTIGWRWPK
jgi:hypothetical protein